MSLALRPLPHVAAATAGDRAYHTAMAVAAAGSGVVAVGGAAGLLPLDLGAMAVAGAAVVIGTAADHTRNAAAGAGVGTRICALARAIWQNQRTAGWGWWGYALVQPHAPAAIAPASAGVWRYVGHVIGMYPRKRNK